MESVTCNLGSETGKAKKQLCQCQQKDLESRVRLRLLDSSQSHRLQASPPPPLQASKQRATSPHAGMRKKKAQAESA